ncbi:PEP-CTERM sorting domain-containing protein [Pseudodesulfovibrio methanolicus]|uniref:PEP-CTERM sorting domain-containing protein n=1 Tax=Pseudodesulfovibrio methanolicus TaxID=3126690 RepID=A0ABZ2IYH3_9BACT
MKQYILIPLLIIGIFVVARPERAEALVLPSADSGFAVTYGDFYSYSLPILQDFLGSDYNILSNSGHIKNDVVIATGVSGTDVNLNFTDMDNAYPTPGGTGSSDTFDTGTTADPAPALDNDRADSWDSTIASLVNFLGGQSPIFLFNNNQTNSDDSIDQNLWIWAQVEIWSSAGTANSQYFELTSTNGDGSGTFGGNPYDYEAHAYDNPSFTPSTPDTMPTDYVLSGGNVCLDGGGAPVDCGSSEVVYGPYSHNLGSDRAAYAVVAPELNDLLADWDGDSPYDMLSIKIKMSALNAGGEQAYILPGTVQTTTVVPEPSTWLLMGLGLLCLPLVRRFRRG